MTNYPLVPSKNIDGDPLLISEKAHAQVKSLMEVGKTAAHLRVAILGGGCSGFQYDITLDETLKEDDILFTYEGVSVIADEASFDFLKGALVDFVEDMMSSQFVIKNPNAQSSCGCGNSFSIL